MRRRIAATIVLLVACAGLLATSYSPVQSKLTTSQYLTVTLTGDQPRATGEIRLSANAAALPVDDYPYQTEGVLTLQQSSGQTGVVSVTVASPGLTIVPSMEYGDAVIPIQQLCRVAEPCESVLQISIEWLAPSSARTMHASVQAQLEMTYNGYEQVPDGAAIALRQLASPAPEPAGPTIRAGTDWELIVLDTDHWAAARHVVLTASSAARGDQVLAFLDRQIGQVPARQVVVTLTADESPTEVLPSDQPLHPFASCPESGTCRRGFTVRFELSWVDEGTLATVHWRLGTRATFADADAVPSGATLSAQLDGSAQAATSDPLMEASTSGEFTADGHGGVSIQIAANGQALPAASFGYLPPAGHAVLTVTSTGPATVFVSVSDDGIGGTSRQFGQEGGSAHIFVNPLRTCAPGQACSRSVQINVTTGGPDVVRHTADITWRLDLAVAYPESRARPSGAEVTLTTRGGS